MGTRSFNSFGNEIINHLNDVDIVAGGDPFGSIREGDEEGDEDSVGSGVQFSSNAKLHDGSTTTTTTSTTSTTSTSTDPLLSKSERKKLKKSGSMAVLQASKHLLSARSKKPRAKATSARDSKMASVFADKGLWNDPSDYVANKVTAFSESSIANSHHQGKS